MKCKQCGSALGSGQKAFDNLKCKRAWDANVKRERRAALKTKLGYSPDSLSSLSQAPGAFVATATRAITVAPATTGKRRLYDPIEVQRERRAAAKREAEARGMTISEMLRSVGMALPAYNSLVMRGYSARAGSEETETQLVEMKLIDVFRRERRERVVSKPKGEE